MIQRWYSHYIDYERLKQSLAPRSETHPPQLLPLESRTWSSEPLFFELIEGELDKVYSFQQSTSDEIMGRIRISEASVDIIRGNQTATAEAVYPQLAYELDENEPSEDDLADSELTRGPHSQPTISDGQSLQTPHIDYRALERELLRIIEDMHDLAKYVQLNYTGLQKIVKKHDKLYPKAQIKSLFAARLNARPFFRNNFDSYIVKLSRAYEIVRGRGNSVLGDIGPDSAQQNFVRQTTKYWVHPDNITELKLIILKVCISGDARSRLTCSAPSSPCL